MLYCHYTHLRAEAAAVATFHKDTNALKRLTPPPVLVEIHRAEPLAEGSLSEFTMWLGPAPVRWVARHADVLPLEGFIDEQIRGPFRRWRHTHRFLPDGTNGCLIEDRIEAELGSGVVAGTISRMMWAGLPFMFAYRGWVLRRALEHPSVRTAGA